jgi:hypothetical protein
MLETNFAQIGGFLYFGYHFWFKMATIANQNGCHMQKNRNRLDKLFRSCPGNKKGGIQKKFGFLSSNFIKLCRNIREKEE